MGQDAVSGPDPGSLGAVDAGAVPAVAAFEGADSAFAAGAPLHGSSKRSSVFLGLSCLAGSALAGDDDGAHPELVQAVVDAVFAVAAVGGDRARLATGAPDDPLDRWGASAGLPGSTV